MRRCALYPLLVTAISCMMPADQSTALRVELDPISDLIAGDTVQAVAHVIDVNGHVVAGVAIEFSSTDPTVAAVTTDGRVVAVSPGTVSILASAPGLESATPGRTSVLVQGAMEIDSIRPTSVRYGSRLHLYGIGLDPSGAAVVNTGGLTAPIASFTPSKPDHPERDGVLEVVVVPPLGSGSDEVTPTDVPVTVTTSRGVATRLASLVIEPRDIYEPNDTTPADLGVITGRFEALGLAFDAAPPIPGYPESFSFPVDWYRFTTTSRGDWTITLRTTDEVGTYATADLIDGPLAATLEEEGGLNFNMYWYIDRPSRRTIGTSGTCSGFAGIFDPGGAWGNYGVGWTALKRQLSWTLEDLPAGTHDLVVGFFYVYTSAFAPGSSPPDSIFRSALQAQRLNFSAGGTRYDLLIEPGIHATLPPDRFEKNDFCEDAPTLLSLDSTAFADSVVNGLTLDAELDYDWFVVEAGTPGRLYVTVESDEPNAKSSPLLLSATLGLGQPASPIVAEGYSDSDGSFGSPQELVSSRDFARGVSLDTKSYYLEIAGGLPRSYRLRFSWAPGAPAPSQSLSHVGPAGRRGLRSLWHHPVYPGTPNFQWTHPR